MATKKWFGLAAVFAAIGGAVAYAVTKVKESPKKAAEMVDTAREKVRGNGEAEASEEESAAS